MELLGLRDVAALLHISEKAATKLLNRPGCPILPRTKGESYLIMRDALIRWLTDGCPEE
jgi:hypothetical protein